MDSADSPGFCVVGSKEHVQAQAACASLDSAVCAAYHDDCVKDHCAGWSTAVEAHTYMHIYESCMTANGHPSAPPSNTRAPPTPHAPPTH